MRNLLFTLILIPLITFGQTEDPCYSVDEVFTLIEYENPAIEINLLSGWNMIGYPCSHPIDLVEAFSYIVNNLIIVKNNNGDVYLPEWEFNGIGFLIPGEGYQVKMSNSEYGFSFCESINWPYLEGCTDCEASNFNRWAIVDDGSCGYFFLGCTEAWASNYDTLATIDDGSCERYGCTSDWADNYDDLATSDDGSCLRLGCTFSLANNYDYMATFDDGSCYLDMFWGCTEPEACNFNVNVFNDDGSCEFTWDYGCCAICSGELGETNGYDGTGFIIEMDWDCDGICDWDEVYGCGDPLALNFEPFTTEDDGSCFYEIFGCMDTIAFNYDSLATTDSECIDIVEGCMEPIAFNYDSLANTPSECIDVLTGCMDSLYIEFNPLANTDDGSCENCDGLNFECEACPYDIYVEYNADAYSFNTNLCQTIIVYGCIDFIAENYNTLANTDDGSCEYILGCMDSIAENYNPEATQSDVTCQYVYGCTDTFSDNFNEIATQDDNSCIYLGCTDSIAVNYNPQANEDAICDYYGCMNTTADNYNEIANLNDYSCIIYGCLLDYFPNYNTQATIDDGSCNINSDDVYGCTDSSYVNFNYMANQDNGSCTLLFQCTDTTACNYLSLYHSNQSPQVITDGIGVTVDIQIPLEFQLIEPFIPTLLEVYVNMEHSYTGDLDILLTAPNGAQVTLFAQAGGGTWLGEATDQDATETNPGVGYDYGWSMNPNYNGTMADGIMADNTSPDPSGGFSTILNSDIYLPIGDFADFIGTNLNGTWTITIVDNLTIDNGWIFSWEIIYDDINFGNPESIINCIYSEEGYNCSGDLIVYGCISDWAENYDAEATDDDGSCFLIGCTSDWADNYDENATSDDGSCDRLGCMSEWADNYDDLATTDNGSCYKDGCTSGWAENYDAEATDDDGSCFLIGCTSDWADNYNELATDDDGICYRDGCNSLWADNYDELATTDDGSCELAACMYEWADNYDVNATSDDGSCVLSEACPYDSYVEYSVYAQSYNVDLCQTLIVLGCMDEIALNFNLLANTNDGSCQYLGCMDSSAFNYDEIANVDDGACIYYGCIDSTADNYDSTANTDDGTCIYLGCIDEVADNYDSTANTDDSTCLYLGCMDEMADNYSPQANQEDGNCIYYGCMNSTADNYDPQANDDDGSCIIYGCTLVNFPNYNSEATVDDFSCDISSVNVFSCTDSTMWNYDPLANIDNGTCQPFVFGCTGPDLCNYNPAANTDDGSCIYPELGYDCEGNWAPYIGMQAEGGIVFYVDETGQHGLVAAMSDIPLTYKWGCFGTCILVDENCSQQQYLDPSNEALIGTGLQNTLDIVAGCIDSPIAAEAALGYQTEGYSDWYLPSIYELQKMYNTIGHGGPEGNIGGFADTYPTNYWSSNEGSQSAAWSISFYYGQTSCCSNKTNWSRVRVIRAF